jgi:uncharacterized protein YyaL (SSP411 family)
VSTESSSEFHFSPRPNRAAEIGWRPWSEAAFEEARLRDKPILLSISAVWCHWCHVMDETTYSATPVIDLVNSEYIPIRVDNDVRPDINQRYNMGGWPTVAFLTPTGDILTGATYLPPEQMAGALHQVAGYYRTNKPEIVSRVLEARKRAGGQVAASSGSLSAGLVDSLLEAVERAYDPAYGGFGNAPKFPHTDAISLLLEQAAIRHRPNLAEMARHTLSAMAEGGTYDHVEGGFFRYSTTQDWSVPHYEKMLEDHAGLVPALAQAGLSDILDSATGYLDRVLRDPESGLYAGSQDADEHYYSLDEPGRAGLETPYVDRRVYASWNAALGAAYLEAALRLDRPHLREAAGHLLERLFADLYTPQQGMRHTSDAGGQLGDQAWALLAAGRAYGAGLGQAWLVRAHELAAHLESGYADAEQGGYFDRAGGEELGRLSERLKPLAENSIVAIGLLELDALAGDPEASYRRRAERALESVAALPRQYGIMAAVFARALDRLRQPPVKVTTRNLGLARAALAEYPYATVEIGGDERAVVCSGTFCLAPVGSEDELAEALSSARRG